MASEHTPLFPRGAKNSGVTKQFLLCCYLTFFSAVIVAGFVTLLELPELFSNFRYPLAALFIFDRFGIELFLTLFIILLLYRRNHLLRAFAYLICAVYIVIQGCQLAAYYQTRDFITGLAIENINHISFLINRQNVFLVVVLLLLCLVPLALEKLPTRAVMSRGAQYVAGVCLLSLIALLGTTGTWLPQGVWKIRENYFLKNNLLHTSPLASLYHAFSQEDSTTPTLFSAFEIQELRRSGFHFNPAAQYPFIKDSYYTGKPPFPLSGKSGKKPNIIVFFSEGISERSLSFSDVTLYPDLTPNIEDFAKKSMVVTNYYSHTAATYRGLLGQLCSLYPKYGGAVPEANYLSLADIFNDLSYETVFFDSHDKDKAHVDELMVDLGFSQVFTAAPLLEKYLEDSSSKGFEALSDNQFLRALVGFLQERDRDDTASQQPFFLCLYNLGTHAFRDVTDDGKKYQGKDNLSLHTIHNYDHAFGSFWSYYQQSPYADNTIVIFTSDHSHIAEKPFVEAFNQPGYQGLFVDKIPLIIHDPTRSLPSTYDAVHATSIDFAPSLLHYLEIPNRKNPFLGTSIFSPRDKRKIRYGIAQHGKEAFLVDNERVHRLRHTQQYKKKLSLINKYIKFSQEIEISGRLWPEASLQQPGATVSVKAADSLVKPPIAPDQRQL